jgi:predicted Zn-dependent protease
MNTYEVNYKGKMRRYRAENAQEAITKFENQNHIKVRIKTVDADTRGLNWAAGYAYPDECGAAATEYVIMNIINN